MNTDSKDQNYKILRGTHIVFILRGNENGFKFIALPGNTTDEEAVQIAGITPSDDWRMVETINFDSIQSNAVPGAKNRNE